MINSEICNWLMDNADAPIRYRTAREILNDKKTAQSIEAELFENPAVILWMNNVKPQKLPQKWSVVHGSFDCCLENALPKIIQLGLHSGLPQVTGTLEYYIDKMKTIDPLVSDTGGKEHSDYYLRRGNMFYAILTAGFLSLSETKDESTLKYMLGSLDELYNFTQKKIYDIYLNEEERIKLKKVPKVWMNTKFFIKPDILREYGFSYPLIYDIITMHKLYDLKNPEADKKINEIINYISTDEFHNKISDGYGILVEEDGKYHSMGWDPKYPGWFDLSVYIKTGSVCKLLFFAQYASKYPAVLKTKWYAEFIDHLDKYRTETGTYLFPSEWLKESTGYAVNGSHMSYGENRRKKNWREIESTFYMHLLQKE